MKSPEIINAILNGTFTDTELRQMHKALNATMKRMSTVNTFTMHAGQNVKFDYKNSTHKGVIKKVNRTTISVTVTESNNFAKNSTCKVPASMLSLV